ncbi:DUF6988 family protein [Rhizobacter fulvus]
MSHDPYPITLQALLARSTRLHAAWQEAAQSAFYAELDGSDLRGQLALDACALTLEHAEGLRLLLAEGIENSALALLRVQHEALLRAAWVAYAATDANLRVLATTHTPATLKQANSLPLAHVLLDEVEKSDAPGALKRGLREFRELSWAGVNSYAHAGLLPLGRVGAGHAESQLVQAIQVSNANCYAALMIAAEVSSSADITAHINLIAVAHPDCMLQA